MKTPVLTIQNLNYAYGGGQKALSNLNLTIFEGEKIAVLGSNGAGKSSLFLALNGVLTPDQGKIYYKDREMTKKKKNDLRKHVGIVFQDADNQIIASTVLAEVSFGPMNLKLPKEEVKTRVEAALNYMNIREFKDRPPHYLSGGEKKRVTIADIIAMKCDVILFDEPTAALDPYNVSMLEEVLEKLSKEGKTLLISTHNIDFSYRWADRILILHHGQILADGSPVSIFQNRKILKQANLNCPVLLDVYETLLEKGILSKMNIPPRTIEDFNKIISSLEMKK